MLMVGRVSEDNVFRMPALVGAFHDLKLAISFPHNRYLLPTRYLLGIMVKINKNPPSASHSVKPLAAGPYSS